MKLQAPTADFEREMLAEDCLLATGGYFFVFFGGSLLAQSKDRKTHWRADSGRSLQALSNIT